MSPTHAGESGPSFKLSIVDKSKSGRSKLGQRLAEAPAPEIASLVAERLRAELVHFDALTENNEAHTLMLLERGIIRPEAARALLRALREIREAGPHALPLDPEREDLYFNYEHEVIRRIGAEIGGQLHTARSRNDLSATLDAVRLRSRLIELCETALALRAALLDVAADHVTTVMPGYTHLQPAQPITLGHYLTAIESALARDTDRLIAALTRADRSPMGAAALAGTGYPIDRARVAELLGFARVSVNTLDAVASRDGILDALAAATILGTTISRFVGDLYVWYTNEFAFVDLLDRVAGTSSIMPQKKNPVLLENVRGRSAHALGALTAAASAVRSTPFTNTIDGNRVGLELAWPALDATRVALELTRLSIANIVVHRQLLRERAAEDFSTITGLADALVTTCAIPFRQAHEIAGAVVRRCMERRMQVSDIDAELVRSVAGDIRMHLDIDDTTVRRALDPIENVNARFHEGGPAPAAVGAMIEAGHAAILADHNQVAAVTARIAAAHALLHRRITEVLERP